MSSIGVLSENPSNLNLFETNKFQFTIPNLRFARYFCQAVAIPGVSTQEVARDTPFHTQFHHGDTLAYDALTLSAQLDEDFRVWEESYNWLRSETAPHKFKDYRNSVIVREDIYNDGILEFNKNSNLPNIRMKFHNCHLTALSAISLTYDATDAISAVCDITIRYDTYTIERL